MKIKIKKLKYRLAEKFIIYKIKKMFNFSFQHSFGKKTFHFSIVVSHKSMNNVSKRINFVIQNRLTIVDHLLSISV